MENDRAFAGILNDCLDAPPPATYEGVVSDLARVSDEEYPDPVTCSGGEVLYELATNVVFMNNIHFEVNGIARRIYRLNPGRIVVSSVREQVHTISWHEGSSGGT